jgi:hypothetical protein
MMLIDAYTGAASALVTAATVAAASTTTESSASAAATPYGVPGLIHCNRPDLPYSTVD